MKLENMGVIEQKYEEMLHRLNEIVESVLNIATNTECIVCGKQSFGKRLCEDCVKVIDGPPSMTGRFIQNIEVKYFGIYEEKLRDFILAYKFRNHHSLSKVFSKMLSQTIKLHLIAADFIVYIPATKTAKNKRGYDHMYLIAKALSKEIGIPVLKALTALRETDQLQTTDRTEAVRGKFALVDSADRKISDRNIILIDDVLTTGSTIKEAIKILKIAKPRAIHPIVVAMNKN
ncbi:competence protein ComFC [Fervidobacterium gondwanense DSM 13020]|uniref:Competence protein ComFC n=2 Tax=Fervidobacteriaceae TaxID=1643950 RepID=A0A1M7SYD3_FERGO|nr:competence protein ComFC [Fervidobacterium gondwanense DSM 13020]